MCISEIDLLGRSQAGEGVEVRGKPAVVLGQEACHKIFRRAGLRTRQTLPGRFGESASRYSYPPVANQDVAAVKIENRGKRKQPRDSRKLEKTFVRFAIHSSHSPVEACQDGIIQQRVQNVAARGVLFLRVRLGPIGWRKQNRHLRGGEGVDKRLAALEGCFQFGQRKARIDGQECPFGLSCLKGSILATSPSHAVAQNCQQRITLLTSRNSKYAFRARQGNQFPRLFHVALEQNQKFSWPASAVLASLVTLHRHIAGEQGQHFFGRHLLTDAGHTQERAQRPWNGYAGR